jgi:hypothetical protein
LTGRGAEPSFQQHAPAPQSQPLKLLHDQRRRSRLAGLISPMDFQQIGRTKIDLHGSRMRLQRAARGGNLHRQMPSRTAHHELRRRHSRNADAQGLRGGGGDSRTTLNFEPMSTRLRNNHF